MTKYAETVFQKHMATIRSGQVDRATINGLRKMLNASERAGRGYSIGRTSAAVSVDSMAAILTELFEVRPLVSSDVAEAGRVQLTKPRYRKQLASVAEIVADLREFRLIGYEPIGRHLEYYTPVYRAYDSAGRSFPFTNVPWQAGGNGPEIMPPNYW